MTLSLANQIFTRRMRAGLTQRQLAKAIGVAPARITEIETGRNAWPSTRTIQRIAKALGCEARVLLVRRAR